MFDIFDQPLTLLGLTVMVLFGTLTVRSVWPERRHWWQWLIPALCVALAFGIDYIVNTDLEKINDVLKSTIAAVENADSKKIATAIAENYSDSYHKSKAELIAHCEKRFSPAIVEKCKKSAAQIKLSSPQAVVTLFLVVTLDKNSFFSQNYIRILQVKTLIYLQKQSDSNWLITQIELREVNTQPVSWRETG
jgi:hypothetical protein